MHFLVVKFKSIKLLILMIIVACLLTVSFNGANAAEVYFGYNFKKVPVYNVQTDKKQVAISFDAAWGADKTEKIMGILKEYNANATFFLVGFWIDKYQDLVKKIDASGFEIGTHSNTHPDLTKLAADAVKKELETSKNMIEGLTGKKVELFRAPFGAYNNTVLEVAEGLKLMTIQWDVDSLDWKGLRADTITTRILSKVKNGSIILCHNNSDHITDALPMILDRLIKQGYEVTSVGNLVYKENYEIDRNGLQKSIA